MGMYDHSSGHARNPQTRGSWNCGTILIYRKGKWKKGVYIILHPLLVYKHFTRWRRQPLWIVPGDTLNQELLLKCHLHLFSPHHLQEWFPCNEGQNFQHVGLQYFVRTNEGLLAGPEAPLVKWQGGNVYLNCVETSALWSVMPWGGYIS